VNILVTIPFSHYCEKARWALDRSGIAYREDGHLPLFSWIAALRAGGHRTVPSLHTGAGAIADSTDILRWCDRHGQAPPLFDDAAPAIAELEERFDRSFGPHTRRLAYFHLLPGLRARVADTHGVPRAEIAVARALAGPIAALMRRGMNIDAASAARSRARIDEIFAEVAARLDGRRYLVGDRLSAADLTFAALAVPVLGPPELADLVPLDRAPPALADLLAHYRATPAGRFALRLYAEERGRS
jgi:glutathione S-transferase